MIVFVDDCAADGCYEKNLGGGKQMCAKHQQMYDEGTAFKAFYGKTVLKKTSASCDHVWVEDECHGYAGHVYCVVCGKDYEKTEK